MMPSNDRLAAIIFAAALFILQLVVTWPNVGQATYLADQLDQTGAFLQLLKGNWQFLYGPFMSDTTPPAHCFGPLGSVLFGLPALLGANPDQTHIFFIGLISIALVIMFLEIHRHNQVLAYLWTAAIFAMPSFWWHHSMLWVNVFLMPIICLELALLFRLLRRPTWVSWIVLLAFFFFGLHIHSSAIIGSWLVAIGLVLVWKNVHPNTKGQWVAGIALLTCAVLPYAIAEISTDGVNIKAVLANLNQFGTKPDHAEGIKAALNSTNQTFSSLGIETTSKWTAIAVLTASLIAIMSGLFTLFLRNRDRSSMSILWLLWGIIMVFQFCFFYFMNRPLLARHYTTFLIPFYAFPWIAVIFSLSTALKVRLNFIPVLATIFLGIAYVYFPKVREHGDWTWQTIRSSLAEICEQNASIDTIEPVPFRAYDDSIETLLRFVGNRHVPACRFRADSQVILLPAMHFQELPPTISRNNRVYTHIRTALPRIGIYHEKEAAL